MCRIDRFEFKWSNAQLIKQNKTKMCRLREDWAQWIDLRLILLKSVLLFQVTYCSVTQLISPNSTMSVNDFHEYKSTPHTNQMNYIQNNKDQGDTNTSKLVVVPFQALQIHTAFQVDPDSKIRSKSKSNFFVIVLVSRFQKR